MVGLRKGHAYSKVVNSYTRKSKFKGKDYIKAVPPQKIIRFVMGDLKKKFEYKVELKTKQAIQLRQNGVESARLVINRYLTEAVGPLGFFMRIRLYPHHVLRENKMIAGAGADRMQTGMQEAFGKPVGLAAQCKKGKTIFETHVDKKNVEIARQALKNAMTRLPGKYLIESKPNE